MDLAGGVAECTVNRVPNEVVQQRLMTAAAQDIEDLRPQLEPRAAEHAAAAKQMLAQRGEREEQCFARHAGAPPRSGRGRARPPRAGVHAAAARLPGPRCPDSWARTLSSSTPTCGHWRTRLDQFEQDLEREPARVREFYAGEGAAGGAGRAGLSVAGIELMAKLDPSGSRALGVARLRSALPAWWCRRLRWCELA